MFKHKRYVWFLILALMMTTFVGQTVYSSGPAAASDYGPVVEAVSSMGGNNAAFLSTSGYVYVNGSNAYGLYGNNTTTTPSNAAYFVKVTTNGTTALSGIDRIHASGGNVMFAWDKDTGKLYAWGNNANLRCGISSDKNATINVAKQVDFLGAGITFDGSKSQRIAAIGGTVALIDANGDVWSWGQASTSSTTPSSRTVDFRLGREITVTTADDTDTVTNDSNSNGIVTDGNAYTSISPARVYYTADGTEKAITIGAGDSKTFYVLTNKGRVYAWGGTAISPVGARFVTVNHPTSGRLFVKMSVSNGAAVALIDDYGTIYVMNENSVALSTTTAIQPADIYGASGNATAAAETFYKVSVGGATGGATFHAVAGDGDVYAWGSNNLGMCAMSTIQTGVASYSPAVANTNLNGAEDFSTYLNNGVMIKSGKLYTWGSNASGQLANGTAVGTPLGTPTQVSSTYMPSEYNSWAAPTAPPTPTNKPNPYNANFVVNDNRVVIPDFIGWGSEYNQNLYADITAHEYGVTTSNVTDLEAKVTNLVSQHVRIFFDPDPDALKYYDSSDQSKGQTPVDPNWDSFHKVVQLAQNTGSTVNVTYWHSSTSTNIIGRMQVFADALYDQIVTHGMSCVKYVTVQNEPNGGAGTDQALYEAAYRALDSFLKDLGIRDRIDIVGGDLVISNQQSWFDYMANNMGDVLDGYSSHIYWDFWDRAYGQSRLDGISSIINAYTYSKQKPRYITEFGVRGYDNTGFVDPGASSSTDPATAVSGMITAAFQHAWFNMESANQKFVAAVRWDCYMAKYDGGQQDFSMIGKASDGYPKRPGYYAEWLMTHATQPGWKVVGAEKASGVTNKVCTAFKGPNGERAIFVLNLGSSSAVISVGGLPTNTSYNLYRWNWSGTGAVSSGGTVGSGTNGVVSINVPAESYAVFTSFSINVNP